MRPTSIVVSPHAGSPPVPFGLMNGFKCACGALFASDIELDTHLKDEQHNASLLDELLKQATIHKRDGFEDKDVLNGESQSVARRLAKHKFDNQYHCPTRGCSLSFPTVQSFRRHKWAEQTTPKEYCPCCPFEATKLSKWLGHLKAHRNIQSQAMAEYLESRKRELIEAADNELALAAPKELLSCVVACNKRNFDDFSLDPTHDPKPPAATTRLVEHIADMNSPGSALKSFVIGQDEAMANRPDGVNETAALHGPTNVFSKPDPTATALAHENVLIPGSNYGERGLQIQESIAELNNYNGPTAQVNSYEQAFGAPILDWFGYPPPPAYP